MQYTDDSYYCTPGYIKISKYNLMVVYITQDNKEDHSNQVGWQCGDLNWIENKHMYVKPTVLIHALVLFA